MTINTYTMSKDQLQGNANDVKELLLDYLCREGKLSMEVAENMKAGLSVVVYEKGFFGKAIDKLVGREDGLSYRLVRMV